MRGLHKRDGMEALLKQHDIKGRINHNQTAHLIQFTAPHIRHGIAATGVQRLVLPHLLAPARLVFSAAHQAVSSEHPNDAPAVGGHNGVHLCQRGGQA